MARQNKGPRPPGEGTTGENQIRTKSTETETAGQGRSFTAPADPMLRAVYRVCQCDDLTPSERLALLALWRYFGGKRKQAGPGLLAGLLSVHREVAKTLLRRLQEKGYVGSDGKCGGVSRKGATRWLTRKAKLPRSKQRGTGVPDGHR